MARCNICQKKIRIGRRVSHSGIKTRRIFKPNIHTAWVSKNGKWVRMKLCTKCLRKVRKEQKEKLGSKFVGQKRKISGQSPELKIIGLG